MVTKEWVAIHRKHHQNSDKEGDPHSPHVEGIWAILFSGAYYYHLASKDKDMINKYGVGTPNDWIEQNVYSKYSILGVSLLLIIDCLLFGWWGLWVWSVQMFWIPFWAAGVINGVGHYFGYRSWNTKDKSKNILPFGIIVGGEELHNNHHNSPASIKLSNKWYEFDIGWMWFNIFKFLRLAK
jgi:stearoyl-CoA desaturase (delta-9 desaturase)